eukprot:gene9106-biopygen8231
MLGASNDGGADTVENSGTKYVQRVHPYKTTSDLPGHGLSIQVPAHELRANARGLRRTPAPRLTLRPGVGGPRMSGLGISGPEDERF